MKYTGEMILTCVMMCLAMPSMMVGAEPPFLSDFETLPIGGAHLGLITDSSGKLWRTAKWETISKSWDSIAMPSVWEGAPKCESYYGRNFFALGNDGSRWLVYRKDEGDKTGLYRVDAKGAVREQLFSSRTYHSHFYSNDGFIRSSVGRRILFRKDGVWISGLTSMRWRSTAGQWKEIPFPTPERSAENRYFTDSSVASWARDTLYSDSKGVWFVRSVKTNASRKNYRSYLLYITPDKAEIVHVTKPNEFITGLVAKGSSRYGLISRFPKDTGSRWDGEIPVSIIQIKSRTTRDVDEVAVQKLLGDLEFGSSEQRDAAMERLWELPSSYAEFLKKERDSTDNADKAKRLKSILTVVNNSFHIEYSVSLGNSSTGNLIYVDRSNRGYVILPGKKILLVSGAKTSKRIPISNENLIIDYESKEGVLYGHDKEYYYRLDLSKKSPLEKLFRQEEMGPTGRIFHVTADGRVGVSKKSPGSFGKWIDVWVNPKKKSHLPLMPGDAIAQGLSRPEFYMPYGSHAATGPGGTFWFVKVDGTKEEPKGRVYRVQNGQIEAMGQGTITLSRGSNLIWPLSSDRAMVVIRASRRAAFGATMIAGKEQTGYARLKDLVASELEALLKFLPEAGGFSGLMRSDPSILLRMGDGLVMQEYYYLEWQEGNSGGSGSYRASGIFRKGRWVEFVQTDQHDRKQPMVFGRWVGVNRKDGTVIGFGPKYKRIIARGIDSKAPRETVLESKDESWAYWWSSHGEIPRFTGCLVMNPKAGDRWLALKDSGKKLGPSDHTGYRFLRDGKWVDVPFSPFRGLAYIVNGQLFHFMMGQVKILLPSGKVQVVETAGSWEATKISRESDDAVWINDVVSMRRMQAIRDEKTDVIVSYKQTHQFSLAKLGYFATGPWFSGGYGYYVVDGTLYMFSLDELKTTQKPKPK